MQGLLNRHYSCLFILFISMFFYGAFTHAATTTYDFNGGGHISKRGLGNNNQTDTSSLSIFADSNINTADNAVATISTSIKNLYPMMQFQFAVSEAAADVTSITITWVGEGYTTKSGKEGAALFIYNGSSYEQLASNTSTGINTLSATVSSNLSNYINGGVVEVLAVSANKNLNKESSELRTDYVKIDIESASPPDISVADTTVIAGSNALFTISIQSVYASDITIDYSTSNGTAIAGTDYTASSGSVTILQGDTSATVSVVTDVSGSGAFNLTLSNPSAGAFTDNIGEAVITPVPQISVSDTTVIAGANAIFTVSLQSIYASDVTIDYATANGTAIAGTDYTAASGTLTILAGDTTATVSVTTDSAGSGSFNLNLSNPSVGTFLDNAAEALISGVVSINHYSISHDGSGVTCLSESITVTAHDSSHVAMDADANSVTLSTTSGKGDWLAILSGGGSLDNGTAGDGVATFTFTSGATTAVLTFSHPDLSSSSETFGFNVSDGSVTEKSGVALGADDPNITFGQSGFVLVDASGNSLDVGTQISGRDSTEALYIQAVEADVSNPALCGSSLTGNQDIGFAAVCSSPSTCVAGEEFRVQGNLAALHATGDVLTYLNQTIAFNGNSRSVQPIELNYSDAGAMILHLSHSDPDIIGNSNTFVVRPSFLGFASITDASSNSNPAGDEVSGSGFVSSGSDFFVAVNAYNDNGDVTPNFAWATSLAVSSYTPASGDAGTLNGGSLIDSDWSVGTASGASATLQYDEVGSISLQATATDYLGESSADIQSAAEKIGRFYPDHFVLRDVVLDDIVVTAGCGGFTYMQQPFAQFKYAIEARPAGVVDGTGDTARITQNYDDASLAYANTAFPDAHAVNVAVTDLGARLSGYSSSDGWVGGVYAVDRTDTVFSRNAGASGLEDGPYSTLQIGISISSSPAEQDGRDFLSADMNMKADDVTCTPSTDCTAMKLSGTQDLRYGRLFLQSAHGPETDNLAVPMVTQYWNGSAFVTSADDSCSLVPLSGITFDGNSIDNVANRIVTLDSGTTTGTLNISGTDAASNSGGFALTFSAPGAGNTGYFPIGVSSVDDWLRYDWDQNGSADDASLTNALVTFGRSRGNDRMIFWQERYQ